MKLTRVSFENVMELEGSITFPEGKTVVIYGENKAGKSNIIHALRYAFLNKVIRGGTKSGYDELKLVTGKEIAPSWGMGRISVEFEHNGKQFEIRREIDRYKDNNKILSKEAEGFRELDFNKTVNKELKAGLLNALFAPDSAMGFNHLNEKNIDAIIRELFKEIGNAKVLTKDFKQRIERLKEEASARVTTIERDYNSLVTHLENELRDVSIDLGDFEKHDVGKTSDKINYVADELKRYIDSIEKGELKEWLRDMRNRARNAEDVEKLLADGYQIIANSFKKMEEISQDKECLSLLVDGLKEIKLGSPMPQEPGKFYDGELDRVAKNIYHGLKDTQTCYSNALSLAQEEKIDLKVDNPARIKGDKEKVLKLLIKEIVTPDIPRVKADLVKIHSEHGEESVHGLIPLELMDNDPAFTKLSPEPIPDAPEEQKRKYAEFLEKKIEKLKAICEGKDKGVGFFENAFTPLLSDLSGYSDILTKNEQREKEKISKLVNDIGDKLRLFTHEDMEMPGLERQGDIPPFLATVKQVVSHKKLDYREEVNRKVNSVGIQAGEFNTQEMDALLGKIAEMEKGLPRYRGIWAELAEKKRIEWENNDAEYADLSYIPAMVDGIDRTLDAILDNAFDEHEVIQGIKEIIVEINNKLKDEDLVSSCIEMGEDSLQLSKIAYKDREITHPCGAERSFFSLAALTALARYFSLPVIIDEAANNLDKNHLRHFISLIREFAANYDVQYILSIKETDDFPLHGWVQGFADDLQIYRVEYDGEKKYIKPVNLYA
jgi:hypothetical protein